ncbi:hypothetical protein [Paenibacillus cymbidii]
MYAANNGSGSVSIIDSASNRVVATVKSRCPSLAGERIK